MNKQRRDHLVTALCDYVKTLNVQPNSILVYKGPNKHIGSELAEAARSILPRNVLIVMLNPDEDLSVMDDSLMADAGWVRSNKDGVEPS